MSAIDLAIIAGRILVIFGAATLTIAYLTWLERKVLGHMQHRCGPLHVGWHGLLQPIADGIKLFFKEDIAVTEASRAVYYLAPFIVTVSAFASFAVIPVGDVINLAGRRVPLSIADVNVGLLYVLGLSSLAVYGIVLAGWSSNNKYALLGGLRSAAQMISYEIPVALALMGPVLMAGSLNLREIVEAQSKVWFVVPQLIAFAVYLVGGVAECNRTPFDLPEAESELVAGYHVEYSSMKFALFFLAEYMHMIVMGALATTLFLGGWKGPWLPPTVWFALKTLLFLFLFIWLRATYPRLRFDQLMRFCWKYLLPLALLNVVGTSFVMALR